MAMPKAARLREIYNTITARQENYKHNCLTGKQQWSTISADNLATLINHSFILINHLPSASWCINKKRKLHTQKKMIASCLEKYFTSAASLDCDIMKLNTIRGKQDSLPAWMDHLRTPALPPLTCSAFRCCCMARGYIETMVFQNLWTCKYTVTNVLRLTAHLYMASLGFACPRHCCSKAPRQGDIEVALNTSFWNAAW